MWALWTERNDVVFNNRHWHLNKLLQWVWLDIVDHRRLEWDQVHRKTRGDKANGTLATHFVQCWCRNEVFAKMADGVPRWEIVGPRVGFVFEPP